MTKLNDLHKEWMKSPEYAKGYDALIAAELVQLKASSESTRAWSRRFEAHAVDRRPKRRNWRVRERSAALNDNLELVRGSGTL